MFGRFCRYKRGALAKSVVVLLAVPVLVYAFSSQPPAGRTGGFGESTCSDCHGLGNNTTAGSVTIGNVPQSYTPGAAVQLTVTIQDSTGGRNRWGFEMSARFRDGRQAGAFAPGANVGVQTQSNVQYAGHKPAQTFSGSSFTYSVTWTAPADSSGGDIVFNAAGNAANGNGVPDSGDHIYTTQAISLAAASSAQAKINSGGILNAASFALPPNNASAPGGLITIFGDNLAKDVIVAPSLPLPKQLGDSKVLVNGVEAALFYVSKLQINAQVPVEVTAGTVPVNVVVRVSGVDSSPEPLKIDDTSPGIITIPSLGTGPGAILHWPDFGLITSSNPTKPNDFVMIFCVGLGLTSPAVASGAAGNAEPTTNLATVTIGGQNAPVLFSGAAPGFAALYQINVQVPNLAAGDHDVVISIAGKQSPAGVKISVKP